MTNVVPKCLFENIFALTSATFFYVSLIEIKTILKVKNNIVKRSALTLVLFVFLSACSPEKSNTKVSTIPAVENLYFGQKPPGSVPELFAPGTISINGRYEHGISFSPDLKELYFSANFEDQDPSIFWTKLEGKKWTQPAKANFTKGVKVGEMHPFISPDGSTLHFAAHDAFTKPEHKESVKTWYVTRVGNSWSEAKQLDSPINDDFVFYSNEAKNGDLFYTNLSKRKMYFAPKINDKYPEVQELGTGGFHGFIAPSEDYLVVNARNKENEERKSDIYVYFKNEKGAWSNAINLGSAVNSNFSETCPSITPDGKYLFFGRYNEERELSNFYWVSTKVIEKLRPEQ